MIHQVDDGVIEEDGEGGFRLKSDLVDSGRMFRPYVSINNLLDEVQCGTVPACNSMRPPLGQ